MRRLPAWLLAAALLIPGAAQAAEGDALLSPDDMNGLRETYEPFLNALADTLITRGLLNEDDRETWLSAQIGDFFSNGAYGSILITYQPDALDYVREEEMAETLSCRVANCELTLSTMRRYSPGDSTSSGLLLSFSEKDAETAMPLSCTVQLDSTAGYFSRWDVLLDGYQAVGTQAVTEGETLVWTAPAPAQNAEDPLLTLSVFDSETGDSYGQAVLRLRVDDSSYVLDNDALTPLGN